MTTTPKKSGRPIIWAKRIAANDPRRKTHRYLVRYDGMERLCKRKPSEPHIDLWGGPRPRCADVWAQWEAWHKSTKDKSLVAAFKAGWKAAEKTNP